MKLGSRAEKAASAVFSTLQTTPSAEQSQKTVRIIEQAMIDSYQDAADRCAKAAVKCCSADKDMAHKVAEEIRLAHTALIANLSGMR